MTTAPPRHPARVAATTRGCGGAGRLTPGRGGRGAGTRRGSASRAPPPGRPRPRARTHVDPARAGAAPVEDVDGHPHDVALDDAQAAAGHQALEAATGEEPQVPLVERAAAVVVEQARGGAAAGVPVAEVRHRDEDLAAGRQPGRDVAQERLGVGDVLEDVGRDDPVVPRADRGRAAPRRGRPRRRRRGARRRRRGSRGRRPPPRARPRGPGRRTCRRSSRRRGPGRGTSRPARPAGARGSSAVTA